MDRKRKERYSRQEAQQGQRLGGVGSGGPGSSGQGHVFAPRAQCDYNTDWSDRRDVVKNEILVLILSKPLVSHGKLEAQRSKISQASRGRTHLPESSTPCPPPCCLVRVAQTLSLPFLTLGMKLHRPVSPKLSPLPHSLAFFRRKACDPSAGKCPSYNCPNPLPCRPCTLTCAATRSRSRRYFTRWSRARTRGSPGRSSSGL